MNKNLPTEIINKILVMRPPHPIVIILREYVDDKCLDSSDVNHVNYCPYIYYYLQNNDCFMMENFNYRYKNYRRMYKNIIKSLQQQIMEYEFYKGLCVENNLNTNEYSFKTFQNSSIYCDYFNF